MKKILIATLLATFTSLQAAVISFQLSPGNTDNEVGLSPFNERPPVLNSSGSGDSIGSGITFDTSTLTLSLSVGYGSAFGFSNLTGVAAGAFLQGPADTNSAGPVVIDLTGLNTPAATPADGGSIIGSVVLDANESSNLLAGLYYLNVTTALNTNGEIRGQLVPASTGPTLVCPASTNAECAGPAGTPVTLTAVVSDADGDALTVVWTANGVAVQTNTVAAGTSTNATSVTLNGMFPFGTNTVVVSVSDGIAPPVTCTTTVAIIDTIPPVILSASVTPDVLWPPNHKWIPVEVSITATDQCSSVVTKIASITSNEAVNAKGSGHTAPDTQITGDLTASLRAERSGKDKGGRVYTITVEAIDIAGNTSETNLFVTVPHDRGHHGSNVPPGNSNGNGNNGNGHGKGK
jgi:hypothetical protein